MPRQFEPYPGQLSETYAPEADPPEINVEEWVPGTHRLPPNLTSSEHVDWRDVNYLGQRIIDLEAELEQNGDPGERFRWKRGDTTPTWASSPRILVDDLYDSADAGDYAIATNRAIAALATSGGEVILPNRAEAYKTRMTLTTGITVRGGGSGTEVVQSTADYLFAAAGGAIGAYTNLSADALAGSRTITLPAGAGAGFAPGDLLLLRSNAINFAANQKTRDIRKVISVSGDVLGLDGSLLHSYLVADTAQFAEVIPLRGVRLADFLVSNPNPGVNTGYVLMADRVLDLRVEGITLRDAGGAFLLQDTLDAHLSDLAIDRLQNGSTLNDPALAANGYGVCLAAACANVTVANSNFRAVRHAISTIGYQDGGGIWGGPRDSIFANLTCNQAPDGYSAFDTHEGGQYLTFSNCIADGGGSNVNGFQMRARNILLADCRAIRCGGRGVTVVAGADNCTIQGGEVAYCGGGSLNAISLAATNGRCLGVWVHHNDAQGITAAATAVDTLIAGCHLHDNGQVIPANTGITDSASTRLVAKDNIIPFSTAQAIGVMSLGATGISDNNVLPGAYAGANAHRLPVAGAKIRNDLTERAGIATVSANYTVLPDDHTIFASAASGAITLTLPPAATQRGMVLTIKKTDASSNAVIVDGNAAETVDGAATKTLTRQNEVLTIICNGATTWVNAENLPYGSYNVRDYGAKGDATSDDKASIQAAIDACGAAGGGQVFFPPGTYRLTSTSTSVGVLYALLVSYDNVQLVGSGASSKLFLDVATNAAMFAIGGASKAARLAGDLANWMNYSMFAGSVPAPGWPLTGSIAEGATSVTLATAGDAANFAVGDLVAIRTGNLTGLTATGQPDAEINVVKSIAGATIGLDVPTVKAYAAENYVSGSTGATAVGGAGTAAPFQLVQAKNYLARGIRIAGLALETRASRQVIIGGGVDGFTAEDLEVLCRGGASFMSFGYTRNQRVRNSRITNRGLTGWTYIVTADAGTSDCIWSNLLVTADANVPYLHIHEGSSYVTAKDITIRGPEVAGDFASVSIRARHYHITLENLKITGGGNTATIYTDTSVPATGGTMRNIQTRNSVASAVAINAPGWSVTDLDSPKSLGVNPTLDNAGVYKQEFLASWLADNRQVATLGTIPQTAMVTDIWMDVTEAFNSDGTDFIRVGFPAGGENWLGLDTDVSTTGTKAAGAGVSFRRALTTDKVIVANYLNGGSEPTTGKALVVVGYVRTPYQIA